MKKEMKISTNTRPNTKKYESVNTKGAAKSLAIMESMLSSITPYHKGSIKTATIAVSLFIRAVNTRGFLTLSVLYRIRPPNQKSANTVTTIVPEVSENGRAHVCTPVT